MTIETLGHIIEAILFVTGEAVEIQALSKGLESTELEVIQALDYLTEDMDRNNRGVCIKRFGSQAQLTTRAEWAPYIEKMLQPVQKQSLSQAALETLSIVAYKQPVTKLEVEAIRGVKCDYSIQSLVSKDLIEEVGRKEALGRPILYGTTEHFLSHFGLASIADLPEKPDKDDAPEGEDLVP
ncbi:MAG: SMC-Scp complex subunit ScpB [Clostridia bacterium]|nr:SMC-Scp complex subunit ScpB [Clostridia bacterium]